MFDLVIEPTHNGKIIEPVESVNLTKDQETAKGMMMQMHDIFILKGYAGTGKTFLLNSFMREVKTKHITLTAPTHKAVGVARGDCTIHSYLNLKLTTKEDKQILTQVGFADSIPYGDLLIIDEASMISQELLRYILEAQEMYDLKIIFVGDPAQIPPVGEKNSPVWELDAPSFTLTDIVRQARDSNIILLASAVRDGSAFTDGVNKFVNNIDVYSGPMPLMKKFFYDCMENSTVAQIISHRNKIVDSSNTWARNIVKSNPLDPFLVGEEVYIRSVGNDQVHKLEDIVEIANVSKPFLYTERSTDFPVNVFRIYVKSYKGEEDLLIPVSDIDRSHFEKSLQKLATKARNKRCSWGQFWKLKEAISEVKHIYSMTCHRSQGSTFENVIVNCNDIQSKRLMYTAVTRASQKLFLLRS